MHLRKSEIWSCINEKNNIHILQSEPWRLCKVGTKNYLGWTTRVGNKVDQKIRISKGHENY